MYLVCSSYGEKMLSYQSANSFPIKLVKNINWYRGRIIPIHLQFNPTNKCNMNCSFCSCADRDISEEILLETAKHHFQVFKDLGGEAITITGGGEPTLHPDIEEMIDFLNNLDIKIGLVTNGAYLDCISNLDKLTWCRVSVNNGFDDKIKDVINLIPIDWALSYVMTDDYEKVQKLIDFVNINHLTHIRLVSDIFEPKPIPKFERDEKVIYQDRTYYTRGGKCYMGLIKPYLNTDGKYYTCCGVQYALPNKPRKMVEELCLGDDLEKIINEQKIFDGSICDKCYYSQYNDFIDLMLKNYKHLEFV